VKGRLSSGAGPGLGKVGLGDGGGSGIWVRVGWQAVKLTARTPPRVADSHRRISPFIFTPPFPLFFIRLSA